jgi:hypothetical protein
MIGCLGFCYFYILNIAKIWLNILMDDLPLEQHHKFFFIKTHTHTNTHKHRRRIYLLQYFRLTSNMFFFGKIFQMAFFFNYFFLGVNWVLLEFCDCQTLKKLTRLYTKFQHVAKNIERY